MRTICPSTILGALGFGLFACALATTLAACGPRLIVRSTPSEAEVSFHAPDSAEVKKLGKTPLELSSSEFKHLTGSALSDGGYVGLVLEKRGYRTEHYLLPATQFGTVLTGVDVRLQEGARDEETAHELLQILFTAQKFAMQGQYERAHMDLDRALKISPQFARALSLRASVYYLQGKYEDSLKYFEDAIKVDPGMDDVLKMIVKVRKKLNRSVASDGATGGGSAR